MFKGSLAAFVVSLNLHRRHLNESQRAMVADRLTTLQRGRSETNASIDAFVTQPQAAKMLNVARESVQRARKVRESNNEPLIASVNSGEVSVSSAAKAVTAAEKYPQVATIVRSLPDLTTIANNLAPFTHQA